ncbi:bifunctional glycosyltransferase, forming alpha-glycosyl and beta-glycosyl linkages protein [Sinorhizobium meliloti CCNWSX0020]|uniref:Bifunctional glycosyltransferase, forming alpha-glycosyl and beta-glycosyl linkages protein n=2 Tax=Sinorhizobium TaxID=28105 RepID=H0FZS1_RHIML|nr:MULTISPECIES: glycosyltransferase [Sinorhizobium]EHK77445.1 bifunctional glycosyltransferase, forming alpha-glycosyl and beta-glycosyl linkages protein [Sinorhizobium meliloti CCNWSX0020]RVG66014.1 glycosyltransferase family 2 protein [Sinorhizobium meliloti]RVH36766.1 glycosyltransferase family 2 protein [Sinorhizobium meliloti]WHS91567.1 glycosyltransferase [Sinorhizobium kummerowiae]WRW48562.1 glycosyltransferase [Sinorhizobium kummerowiae]
MTFDDRTRSASGIFEDARVFRLGSEVAVLISDVRARLPVAAKHTLVMPEQPVPLVSTILPLTESGQRVLWAMRPGAVVSRGQIYIESDVVQTIVLRPVGELPPLDVEDLFAALTPEGCVKFLNNLLTVWRSAFRLSRDPFFIGLVEDALQALTSRPAPAKIACPIAQGRYLIETAISPDFGEISGIYALGANAILPLASPALIGAQREHNLRPCHFIVESPRYPQSFVLVGKRGVAVRELSSGNPHCANLQAWWAERGGTPELREFVVRWLSTTPEGGLATAVDLQLRTPLPERRIGRSAMHPSAEVDLALTLSGGLLAGGWTHDPTATLAGIDYLTEDGTAIPLDGNWYEFPAWARGADEKSRADVTGFVAWLPSNDTPGALLQPRFQMRLASGAVKPLVPKPQPFEASAQRNRILRAVPPQHANDQAFRTILAPALQDVEQRLGRAAKVDYTKDYDLPEKAPVVSIVVPLYRVLDFLRFQLSGMATDRWLASNAEIIYVLDSPEIQDETEHLLGGLHLLHGLPMKLVVMNRNSGYARACNAGARFARGSVVVMLNSDVVPSAPGWLQKLIRPLMEQRSLGAIGPKLIFEDGSLQHAGLYFARDQRGIWLNHHFHKGMPGDYAPAQLARSVPGITGACLVTRREIYELVDGYTEDYVIGDYEDSDLCLKIRRCGYDIAYEPSACLYHFERRSIRRSEDYMRGVASQYNSWLHTERWNDDITELMNTDLGGRDQMPALFGIGAATRTAA